MSALDDTYELDGRQKSFRALIITSFSITGAFIATRCWVRLRLQAQFTADDYLLVIALVVYAIQTSFGLYAIDYGGFGRAAADLPPAMYVAGLKWIIFAQCTYPLVMLFARLSIALLQLRIMGLSTAPPLRRAHYITMVVGVLISLLAFFTALVRCDVASSDPAQSMPAIPGLGLPTVRCRSFAPIVAAGYAYSIVSILLDLYYALATVPAVWALRNVGRVVRLSVIVILGMGVLASVATVVRLVYLVRTADSREPLRDIVPIALWSTVEGCMGMCAACLATLRPLLKRVLEPFSSWYGEEGGPSSSRASSWWSGGNGRGGKRGRWGSGEKGRRGGEVAQLEELERGSSAVGTLQGGNANAHDAHGDVECGREGRGNGGGWVVEHAEDDGDAIHTNPSQYLDDGSTMTRTARSSNTMDYSADEDSQKSILRHKSASLAPS